jgi:flavin reductase (DIM6/NTAB) family NADH-FMN oxidoreductase RutF
MDLEQGFKNAMSCWASGVSVVAARDGEGLAYGLTVSSFNSVSLDPPLVSVCLANSNRLPAMAQAAGGFAVSILALGQQDISNHFASRGREPVAQLGVPTHDTPGGHPAVEGSCAWLDCTVAAVVEQGDHTVLIGQVQATESNAELAPLLYYRRAYRTVTEG